MTVAIISPFQSRDSHRIHAKSVVNKYLSTEFPQWEHWYPAGIPGEFSRAQAINLDAEYTDADILVFNDADCLAPPDQVHEAVRLAHQAPGLVWAYDFYCRLTRAATIALRPSTYLDAFLGPFEWAQANTPSHSCSAIRRECFLELGGYNTDYTGWGYEDCDLTARSAKLWPTRRVQGKVVHLWHGDRRPDDSPEDTDPILTEANLQRYRDSLV